MTFNEHFNKLYPHIQKFVFFGWYIRKELGNKEIIGINCSSSSAIRFIACKERVLEAIQALDLPLIIEDCNEKSNHFKILNKHE